MNRNFNCGKCYFSLINTECLKVPIFITLNTQFIGQEIVFEELQRPEEDQFVVEDSTLASRVSEKSELDEDEVESDASETEFEEEDDMDFTCLSKKGAVATTTSNVRQERNITQVERNEKTFFVCPCGFSSTNKSGSSRHKCRDPMTSIEYECSQCEKKCKNPGSLSRHIKSVHKRQSVSLPTGNISVTEVNKRICNFCGKVLASARNVKNRIARFHVHDVDASDGAMNNFSSGQVLFMYLIFLSLIRIFSCIILYYTVHKVMVHW